MDAKSTGVCTSRGCVAREIKHQYSRSGGFFERTQWEVFVKHNRLRGYPGNLLEYMTTQGRITPALPLISVVVSFYNEERNLPTLILRLRTVLRGEIAAGRL